MVMIKDGVVHVAKVNDSMIAVMQMLSPDPSAPLLAMQQGESAAFDYGGYKLKVGTSPTGVPTFSSQAEADAWLDAHINDVIGVPGWSLA